MSADGYPKWVTPVQRSDESWEKFDARWRVIAETHRRATSHASWGHLLAKEATPLLIMGRIIWQVWPSLLTFIPWAAMFYVIPICVEKLGYKPNEDKKYHWLQTVGLVVSLLGLVSNQIVILVNGGFMPVAPEYADKTFSVWVRSPELSSCNLCFLSDVLPTGASIGDVAILFGIVIGLLFWIKGKIFKSSPNIVRERIHQWK